MRIDLPVDDATVKEKRAEAFVNVGRKLSPHDPHRWRPHLRIFEHQGPRRTVADRTLKFLKPSLTLDWKPGNGWHGQLSVRRIVAQLDFYDFISVAELSTDRVNAGNENLQPQRTWEFRATVEHPLLGDGLVKLDVGYDLSACFRTGS